MANDNASAVKVIENRSGVLVKFPYHPELIARIKRVKGADFDEKKGGYWVPKAEAEAAKSAANDIRDIVEQDAMARADIERLATATARVIMSERNVPKGIEPVVSAYRESGKAYIGDVINANGRYAAQLTGFGRENGAAFVLLHRLADFTPNTEIFKGDRVAVTYDEKGRAAVRDLPPEFDKTLGGEVDGVKVQITNNEYHISFGFNQAMSERLNRVAGVEFDSDKRVYKAPLENREFVIRAVNDMRKMHVAEAAELRELTAEAGKRMDGAKVVRAFMNGTHDYKGEVIAKGEQFILQHTGREYFTAHRARDLDRVPDIGSQIKIRYQSARGQVLDATAKERSHGR